MEPELQGLESAQLLCTHSGPARPPPPFPQAMDDEIDLMSMWTIALE